MDREAFEAHMRSLNATTHLGRQQEAVGGQYRTITVERNWQLWQAAIKHEREACAKLCDEHGDDYMQQAREGDTSGASDHKADAAAEIADAIRARSAA
jgi:hypothetical protein